MGASALRSVERITYQNEENGYTVLKCAVKTIVTW